MGTTRAAVVTALVKHGSRRAGLSGTTWARAPLTDPDYLTSTGTTETTEAMSINTY